MITNVQQFEALFNHATIGIIMTDKEGKIVNINKYAETQFGYSNKDLIGKTAHSCVFKHLSMRVILICRESRRESTQPCDLDQKNVVYGS